MQIPEPFYAFEKPTLIAVTDNARAKIYCAEDRTIKLVKEITSGHPSHTNEERASMITPSGQHSAEQNEKDKVVSREKLYRKLDAEIVTLSQKESYDYLVYCAPQEHMKELQDHVHMKLYKLVQMWYPKNLVNDDPIEIVAHIQEAY
jgi:protein required for attachment to host cells